MPDLRYSKKGLRFLNGPLRRSIGTETSEIHQLLHRGLKIKGDACLLLQNLHYYSWSF